MPRTAVQTTTLTAEQRESLREVLVTDREATESLIARLIADLESFTSARTDSATDDEHDPEGPTLAFERSQATAILEQTREHLAQIDRAVDRLGEGSFGACASCGEPIPFARLEVRPYSTQCVACASKARR